MSLSLRQNVALTGSASDSDDATYANGFTVTAYPVGAVAVSVSGSDITVDAGHSFGKGDKVYNFTSGTFIAEALTSVDATSLVYTTATPTISAGDLLVNLGPDTATGATPNYDGSKFIIYSDADGGTAISNSRVTVDTQGNYAYYHKGDGRAWELIRDALGAVVSGGLVRGWSALPYRHNVHDFGAAGDGATDDSLAFQAVQLAAQVSGGVCKVGVGTYLLNNATAADIQITGDDTWWDGMGSDVSIIKSGASGTFTSSSMFDVRANNTKFSNLYFDCDHGVVNTSYILNVVGARSRLRIEDCTFDGANVYAVRAENTGNSITGFWCERSRFIDNKWGINFVVAASSDIHIDNCTFDHPNRSNTDTRSHVAFDRDVKDATVSNCYMNKGRFGVAIASCTDVTVTGCVIEGQDETVGSPQCIHIETTAAESQCQRVTITGNILSGPTNHGIGITSTTNACKDITITGNVIHTCGSSGVGADDVADCIVVGNVIHTCEGPGITVIATNSLTNHVVIANNIVYNNQTNAEGNANINIGAVTNCVCMGNICYDDQGTATVVRHIRSTSSASNLIVRDNIVDTNATTAAYAVAENIPQFANSDATPSVASGSRVYKGAVTGIALTDLDDGYDGQVVTILAIDGATTIADSGNFVLDTAWAPAVNDTITLFYSGTTWYEISRMNAA